MTMTQKTGSDRFMVVPGNQLPSPGKCWCCGNNDIDCVHWGYDEDFVGVILLCRNCVLEASSKFVADDQSVKIAELESIINTLLGELENSRVVAASHSEYLSDTLGTLRKHFNDTSVASTIANGARTG